MSRNNNQESELQLREYDHGNEREPKQSLSIVQLAPNLVIEIVHEL